MIIALDPGYGNTKVVIDGAAAVLQSAVARPKAIGMAAIGMRRNRATAQVATGGLDYVAGDGAWLQGDPIGGMDYSAIASEARRVLFYTALSTLLNPGAYEASLVVGLPVPLLQNEAEAASVLSALKAGYKTTHAWAVDDQHYSLAIPRLQVLAQPVGAYADWLIDGDLKARRGGAQAEVAILDLGMNTLDLYVVAGGRVVERFVGGAKVGVRRLLAQLNGHGQDLVELDHELRMGQLKPSPAQLAGWLDEVLSQVERTWPTLKRFSAVIPAGGGAVVLGNLLRDALADRGAAVAWPADPVATNARGLWKWAAYAKK
jgi:hypothetical protein